MKADSIADRIVASAALGPSLAYQVAHIHGLVERYYTEPSLRSTGTALTADWQERQKLVVHNRRKKT